MQACGGSVSRDRSNVDEIRYIIKIKIIIIIIDISYIYIYHIYIYIYVYINKLLLLLSNKPILSIIRRGPVSLPRTQPRHFYNAYVLDQSSSRHRQCSDH